MKRGGYIVMSLKFLTRVVGSGALFLGTVAGAAAFGTGTASAQTAGLARAEAVVAANAKEPTSIPTDVALTKTPPKGIKVAFLTCAETACSLLNPGFIAAAHALGWDPTVITYNTATPGDAVQQAIDAGNQYVATTSIPMSTITPQVAEAQSKGIALFGAYTSDVPKGKANGLYGVAQDLVADQKSGALQADWMIANSKGKPFSAVYVTLPIYPSLNLQQQGAQKELAHNCPACTLSVLPLTGAEVGAGQTASEVVSYLQQHPSTKYVYFSFQDLFPGVSQALSQAGLAGKVTLVGTEAEAPELSSIVNSESTEWSILPEPYVMWVVVDWMARLSVHQLYASSLKTGNGMQFVVSTPAQAKSQLAANGGNWPGPPGYEAQFEKLWKVPVQ